MKTLRSLVVAIGLLWFQSGCMTPAQKLEEAAVAGQLREGQTQEEARRLLGAPKRSEAASNGNTLDVFVVVFPKTVARAGRLYVADVRSLHVLYNPEGRVEKFTYYVGQTKGFAMRYDEPWRTGPSLDMDKVNRIQRNATTRDDLIHIFGPATIEGLDVYGNKIMSWVFLEGRNTSLTAGRELFVRLNPDLVATDYLVRNIQP